MNIPKIDYKGWAKTGVVFGIVAFLFGKLMVMIAEKGLATFYFAVADFDVATPLRSGVNTGFDAKIMAYLQGIPIVGAGWINQLLVIGLSSIAIFFVGRLIIEGIFPAKMQLRGKVGMLAETAAVGSLVVGLLLGLMITKSVQIPIWTAAFSTFIAFGVVALVYMGLHKFVSDKYFPVAQ